MQNQKERWEKAQGFEQHEWTSIPDVVKREWEELKTKFSARFSTLSENLQLNVQSRILDIGCGPTCASRLFPIGVKIGIDPLADKLGYAGVVGDVEVHTSAGEHIPFEDKSFDIVVCINAIDHTASPLETLREARRVLKEGGKLALACYTYNPFIYLIKVFSEKSGFMRNIAHPHNYTPEKLANLVIEAGFKLESSEIIYEGKSPTDYGKSYEIEEKNPFFTNLVLFMNYRILNQKYFVREMFYIASKI